MPPLVEGALVPRNYMRTRVQMGTIPFPSPADSARIFSHGPALLVDGGFGVFEDESGSVQLFANRELLLGTIRKPLWRRT